MTKLGSLYLNRLEESVSRFKKKNYRFYKLCVCVCVYMCMCACVYIRVRVFFIFFSCFFIFHREVGRGGEAEERKKKNWTTRPSPKNHFFLRPKIVRNSFLVLLRIPFFFNSSDCVSLWVRLFVFPDGRCSTSGGRGEGVMSSMATSSRDEFLGKGVEEPTKDDASPS